MKLSTAQRRALCEIGRHGAMTSYDGPTVILGGYGYLSAGRRTLHALFRKGMVEVRSGIYYATPAGLAAVEGGQ